MFVKHFKAFKAAGNVQKQNFEIKVCSYKLPVDTITTHFLANILLHRSIDGVN